MTTARRRWRVTSACECVGLWVGGDQHQSDLDPPEFPPVRFPRAGGRVLLCIPYLAQRPTTGAQAVRIQTRARRGLPRGRSRGLRVRTARMYCTVDGGRGGAEGGRERGSAKPHAPSLAPAPERRRKKAFRPDSTERDARPVVDGAGKRARCTSLHARASAQTAVGRSLTAWGDAGPAAYRRRRRHRRRPPPMGGREGASAVARVRSRTAASRDPRRRVDRRGARGVAPRRRDCVHGIIQRAWSIARGGLRTRRRFRSRLARLGVSECHAPSAGTYADDAARWHRAPLPPPRVLPLGGRWLAHRRRVRQSPCLAGRLMGPAQLGPDDPGAVGGGIGTEPRCTHLEQNCRFG